jgi:hypothetical protein
VTEETIDADGDLQNSDWMRAGAWDIWTGDDPPQLVESLAQLRRAIGANGPATDREIAAFMKRPAARAMPDKLRAELRRHYSRR